MSYFKPTAWQMANAVTCVFGPMVFAVVCASGYTPSNRMLGAVLGLIGVTVGQNWMSLQEVRATYSHQESERAP